jgi:hypothetical protein
LYSFGTESLANKKEVFFSYPLCSPLSFILDLSIITFFFPRNLDLSVWIVNFLFQQKSVNLKSCALLIYQVQIIVNVLSFVFRIMSSIDEYKIKQVSSPTLSLSHSPPFSKNKKIHGEWNAWNWYNVHNLTCNCLWVHPPPPCFLCMVISSDINNKTKRKPSERLYFFVFVFFLIKANILKNKLFLKWVS